MLKRATTAACAALFATALGLTACHDQGPAAEVQPAEPPAIVTTAIMTQLSRLADDSMLGRGSGTANELRAANYIRAQFQQFGLDAPTGGAIQTFASGTINSQNVIGLLPGQGTLKDEWLIVGAHYDHTGIRTVSGATVIYNGADDNASGTSALLSIAQQAALYVKSGAAGTVPRRSLMFIAFGAEELGLVGSEYYTTHPLHPLNTVYAMLNFDMIGRMQDSVWVGTSAESSWWTMLQSFNTTNLRLTQTTCGGTDCHYFALAQRPILWFFTGLHADYHRPTDDVALINQDGITRITNLADRIMLHLALTADPLHTKTP